MVKATIVANVRTVDESGRHGTWLHATTHDWYKVVEIVEVVHRILNVPHVHEEVSA